MMEQDLVDKLLETSSISAIVGTRINWITRPQNVPSLPALVLTKLSSVGQVTHDGPDNLYETSVQFDCWAETFGAALSLGNALKVAMIGAKFTQGTTKFQGVFLNSERHSFEEPGSESPVRYARVSIDLRLWHNA